MVCASTGPAGEAVAVWTAAGDLEAVTSTDVRPAGASFPDPVRPAGGSPHHGPRSRPGRGHPDPRADLGHITVQPMPGDRFLVAGARCRWRRDGPDRNAVLYDGTGTSSAARPGRRHCASPGDQHRRGLGRVSDEGIFGNYGWGQADTDEPIGAYGIVQFSPASNPPGTSRTTPPSGHGTPSATLRPQRRRQLHLGVLLLRLPRRLHPRWHRERLEQRHRAAPGTSRPGSRVALFGARPPATTGSPSPNSTATTPNSPGQYRVVLPGRATAPSRDPGHRPRKPTGLHRRAQLVPARHGRHPGMITPRLGSSSPLSIFCAVHPTAAVRRSDLRLLSGYLTPRPNAGTRERHREHVASSARCAPTGHPTWQGRPSLTGSYCVA